MTGRVEAAIRDSISPGDRLATPSGRGQFTVARYTDAGLVLPLGEKEAWTPLPWKARQAALRNHAVSPWLTAGPDHGACTMMVPCHREDCSIPPITGGCDHHAGGARDAQMIRFWTWTEPPCPCRRARLTGRPRPAAAAGTASQGG
jgi:hypothetical protein